MTFLSATTILGMATYYSPKGAACIVTTQDELGVGGSTTKDRARVRAGAAQGFAHTLCNAIPAHVRALVIHAPRMRSSRYDDTVEQPSYTLDYIFLGVATGHDPAHYALSMDNCRSLLL
jgi:hypothetical protein